MCLALTYDELASLVLGGDLDPKLVLWIKEEFSDQFAATFVYGVNETFTMKPHRNIAVEVWMNLDGPVSCLRLNVQEKLKLHPMPSGTDPLWHSSVTARKVSYRSASCQPCVLTCQDLHRKAR